MHHAVTLDEPETWPDPVERFVLEAAYRLKGTSTYTNDLDITPEEEDAFRANALAGHLLVAYHCTRLLDREAESIKTVGLRTLTRELVEERITLAAEDGALTAADATSLLGGHVFATGTEQHREGQICLFASRRTLDDRVNGIWRLLATWGGEGIYFTAHNDALEGRLRTIGTPSIVVAAVDMGAGWRTHPAHPGTLRAFTGRCLDFDGYDTGVNYATDILSSNILHIWQPGDADYDIHEDLPRL